MTTLKRPLVALIGRSNVGKSTLWNRLTETSQALVSPELHTTRDRKYGTVLWNGAAFDVVDTGGLDVEKDEIGAAIRRQTEQAIKQADLVLFMVDVQAGILPQDAAFARLLRSLHKHVWLVANKADRASFIASAHQPEFYKLNLGEPHAVSAATSMGVGDLLDEIMAELARLKHPAIAVEELLPLRLVFIGRPNVGKSSLVNAILGEERVIVSPVPHTTREPQDTYLRYKDHDFILVDTAGMRRTATVKKGLEEAGIERNEEALKRADVACLVFDASEDPTSQDRHLAGLLEEKSQGLILVANKWDLVADKETGSTKYFEMIIRQLFPFLEWAPIIFTSAVDKQRVTKLLDIAQEIQAERYRHIDRNALNRLLKACIKAMKPLASFGPYAPRLRDVEQVGQAPPTFLLTVYGEKVNLHQSWLKFFEKRLRQKFGFRGTPIVVKVRHLPTGANK